MNNGFNNVSRAIRRLYENPTQRPDEQNQDRDSSLADQASTMSAEQLGNSSNSRIPGSSAPTRDQSELFDLYSQIRPTPRMAAIRSFATYLGGSSIFDATPEDFSNWVQSVGTQRTNIQRNPPSETRDPFFTRAAASSTGFPSEGSPLRETLNSSAQGTRFFAATHENLLDVMIFDQDLRYLETVGQEHAPINLQHTVLGVYPRNANNLIETELRLDNNNALEAPNLNFRRELLQINNRSPLPADIPCRSLQEAQATSRERQRLTISLQHEVAVQPPEASTAQTQGTLERHPTAWSTAQWSWPDDMTQVAGEPSAATVQPGPSTQETAMPRPTEIEGQSAAHLAALQHSSRPVSHSRNSQQSNTQGGPPLPSRPRSSSSGPSVLPLQPPTLPPRSNER